MLAKKILLVDDDEVLTDMMTIALEHNGYEIVAANSGEEAIARLRDDVYDIMLMDMNMPGMSGLECAREARKICPSMAVMLITGEAVSDDGDVGPGRTVDRVIVKPFGIAELIVGIEELTAARNNIREETVLGAKDKKHVLIADDDFEFVEEIACALEHQGYKVSYVNSGEEAVDKVKREKVDMVLMDVKMPGIGGVEAIKKIRKINASLPVIVVTGSLGVMEKEEFRETHCTHVVLKPFALKQLLADIKIEMREQ